MTTKHLNLERLLFSDRDLVKILIPRRIEQCLTNVVGLVNTMMISGLDVLVMLALYLMQNLILRHLFGSIEPAVEANARVYLRIACFVPRYRRTKWYAFRLQGNTFQRMAIQHEI